MRPTFDVNKGFRLTEAQALALARYAEVQDCDESVILRYALSRLPAWKSIVATAQRDLDRRPDREPKRRRRTRHGRSR